MTAPLQLINAAANPTVNSDSSKLSLEAGTLWRNTTTGDVFVCSSAAPGAAVWAKLTQQLNETTSDPTVNNDAANSYVAKGSLWRNTASGDLFICTDPTTGAAVWKKMTLQPYMPSVQASGTTLAPTAAQTGSRFIITNAASVTVTLPTLAEGLVYEFLRAGDEEMIVASAAGDDMLVGNDLAADSVTFTTAGNHIGAMVRVEGIMVVSTLKWLVTIPHTPLGTGLAFHTYGLAT